MADELNTIEVFDVTKPAFDQQTKSVSDFAKAVLKHADELNAKLTETPSEDTDARKKLQAEINFDSKKLVKLVTIVDQIEAAKAFKEAYRTYINRLNELDTQTLSSEEREAKVQEIKDELTNALETAKENGHESVDLATVNVSEYFDEHGKDVNLEAYVNEIKELRKDGQTKIEALTNEIKEIKLNKQIDEDTKSAIIKKDETQIARAKVIRKRVNPLVNKLMKEASQLASIIGGYSYHLSHLVHKDTVAQIKDKFAAQKKEVESNHVTRKAAIGEVNIPDDQLAAAKEKAENEFREREASIDADTSLTVEEKESAHTKSRAELDKRLVVLQKRVRNNAVEEHNTKKKAESILYKSQLEEIKGDRDNAIAHSKEGLYDNYLNKYGYYNIVRNNKFTFAQYMEFKFRHYIYNFKLSDYLLRNALYFVVIILFLFFIIYRPSLLSYFNIVSILSQSSTKLFYSLGVAGLILLAGTDLSVGRITGMGVTLACLFMSGKSYTINSQTFGSFTVDMTSIPIGAGVIIALLISILCCVIFTTIAGFFTAKFKMHPFITTLSTQLLIFGFMMLLFGSISTFNADSIRNNIQGSNGVYLIIYAAITTIIVWFIWNKTKFGKYMYAVGGNSEAAAVSGINVFAVTLCVFIMAGVLYGLGGFFEATRIGAGNPSTGYGTELNAIAACVIGGVSFSGGVGKISGVVVGTIVFQGLTYCLTYIQVDANMQYIFQGIIIMAAVCLDSIKYLKKK